MRLPLFPLEGVLFPGETMPLHVFEPRYKEMVGRCLEHDEPFGVVFILEGSEVGTSVPRRIGTEAGIIAAQRYRDGRYDIVVAGRRRFEIMNLDRGRPLLRAEVRFLEEPWGDAAEDLAEPVARLFEGILESLEISGEAVIDETWKGLDPLSLSYKVASALPVEPETRQELLEIPAVAERLRREADLLMSIARVGAKAGAA
ncbi:MAG: hypothetical protein A3K68_05000 [Euryarchaeota archaeon RBG_16_68_13]|nr:MAG: hypothetical protein A3K68_05000 [Euryarchaeota archaeon RBG_16_68_13]